ncbi:sialate O-acetylesterase [Dyadobacter tibetensis]|uniref:sialate O-acetylesterase n=1 Tax=Dyadobacter tibetensis TaxID=1211851 RepID=UPI000470EA34|nr:sialate O-acetylesterase [Dyadobacter tibetensis]
MRLEKYISRLPKPWVFLLVLVFLSNHICQARIRLPRLISDGAIMQQGVPLKIWGWASSGEEVALDFKGGQYKVTANETGMWSMMLPAQEAGGPFTMTFIGSNQIKLNNILFGEVWLCSGQSNMELTMERLQDRFPKEISDSENPMIRQFLVPDQYDFNNPRQDLSEGEWKPVNSKNIFEFSGVAYFFAKEFYRKNKIPVGIINAAMGGSPVEAWMSEEALTAFPDALSEMHAFKDSTHIQQIERADNIRRDAWFENLRNTDLGQIAGAEWYRNDVDDSRWKEMTMPDYWANQGLGEIQGAVWFRKTVMVTEAMLGQSAKLWLGRMVDQNEVYVNGVFVGGIGYQYPPSKFVVPAHLLKTGANTITVRVINQQGKGGFIKDKPYFLATPGDTIDLKGNWKFKLGAKMLPLEGPTFVRWKPGGLYNAMVSPLLNYRIKGVLWFQGESNTAQPQLYYQRFPALIADWRAKWGTGDFPFLYVQLANYMEPSPEPVESKWAELRQAQLNTLSVPNTGMVVSIDLGEWNDIHPENKKAVGERLEEVAEVVAYHRPGSRSPVPGKYNFTKKYVDIWFRLAPEGIQVTSGKEIKYFELSSNGIDFVAAKAVIKGNKVRVWSAEITKPTVLRYAWSNNPENVNFYGKNELPVSPFEIKDDKK